MIIVVSYQRVYRENRVEIEYDSLVCDHGNATE